MIKLCEKGLKHAVNGWPKIKEIMRIMCWKLENMWVKQQYSAVL